ncbi:hypothetical protein AB3R30_25065 [Leptolyngbyaceae cyanobacterium UHCC 1019]
MKGTLIIEAAIATVVLSVVASTFSGLGNPAASTTISTTVHQSPTQLISVRLPIQP